MAPDALSRREQDEIRDMQDERTQGWYMQLLPSLALVNPTIVARLTTATPGIRVVGVGAPLRMEVFLEDPELQELWNGILEDNITYH